MTLLVVLMLGGGVVLIISAIECVSLVQTVKDVWNGDVAGYTWQCGGNGNSAIGNAAKSAATAPFIPPLGPNLLPGGAGPGASGGADLYGWEGWSSWHTRS